MSEPSEVLLKLQEWIRSAGTDEEREAPPQAEADAAIVAVLAELADLRAKLEQAERELAEERACHDCSEYRTMLKTRFGGGTHDEQGRLLL